MDQSGNRGLSAALAERGISRRAFLQFATAMTAALALPAAYAPRVARAVAASPRLPVVWLRGQSCGGGTETLLRSTKPTTAELFLDLLSVDYHEGLMAASGGDAELTRQRVMERYPNGYLAVVEGSVPLADGGIYCLVGGRPFADIVREVSGGALGTIALGSCAFDGGAPGASGGQTQAAGAAAVVGGSRLIALPGCPPNPDNLAATIVHYLTFHEFPVTDGRGRPLFAYGGLIHNQCERRAHFEFGEFVRSWGDEGAQKGWCLYKMGCKGPEGYANCPTVRFAEGTSWPVAAGHGCIGCTTPRFWDAMGPAYQRLPGPIPFAPAVTADQIGVVLVGGVAALTVAHGTATAVRDQWDARHGAPEAPEPELAQPEAAAESGPELAEPEAAVGADAEAAVEPGRASGTVDDAPAEASR